MFKNKKEHNLFNERICRLSQVITNLKSRIDALELHNTILHNEHNYDSLSQTEKYALIINESNIALKKRLSELNYSNKHQEKETEKSANYCSWEYWKS